MSNVGLWHCLAVKDAETMITWFRSIGFTEQAIYRDDKDPTFVHHAEYLWPSGGGIMFGSNPGREDWPSQPGTGTAYLVCDDCDAVFDRAVAAGATVLTRPEDKDYGGRGAAVRDPEGNIWSFGTYIAD